MLGLVSLRPEVSVCKGRVKSTTSAVMPLAPVKLWALLAFPESAPVFRVEGRKQLSHSSDGVIVEQVTFVAPVRIVFWKKWARTEVHQTVDMRDPTNVRVEFHLLHSDMMSHLSGSWHFEQLQPPSSSSLGSTRVTYKFEMWPKGVPTALRFMPGLLDAVKAAVSRESVQLFEKLAFVASKVQLGRSLVEGARLAAAQVEAAGSFKVLVLQQSGDAAAAAAAAAAEIEARQLLKLQLQLQKQQEQVQTRKVVCHALSDLPSDDEEESSLRAVDSCSSGGSSRGSIISRLTAASSGSGSDAGWESEPGSARNSSASGSAEDGMRSGSPPDVSELETLMSRLLTAQS